MAASAVSVETLFPLALFSRRARRVVVPAGLMFLVGIRVLMGPTFEQFMMCYVFWVPWERVTAIVRDHAHVDLRRRLARGDADRLFTTADEPH
jgi:hypothetical protein